MSELTYRDGPAPRINLPVSGEPPEGDVFEMVDNPDAPDMSTGPDSVKGYLHDKNTDISTALRVQRDYDYRLKVQAEDAKAARALEIRADFPQGPAVDRYNFNGAADDGNLPAKGASAEMFDPRYSIAVDERTVDEKAADAAMPNLFGAMGLIPSANVPTESRGISDVQFADLQALDQYQAVMGRTAINALATGANMVTNFARDLYGGRDTGVPGETAPNVFPTMGEVAGVPAPGTAERLISTLIPAVLGGVGMSRVTGTFMAQAMTRETVAALMTEVILNDPRGEFGGTIAPTVLEYFGVTDKEVLDSVNSRESHSALVGRIMQGIEGLAVVGGIVGAPLAKTVAEGLVDSLGKHIASLPQTTAASRQAGKVTFHVPTPTADTVPTVSTRVPSAKKSKEKGGVLEDASGNLLRTGSDAMAAGGTLDKGIASFDKVPTSFAPLKGKKFTQEEKLAHLTRGLADNLLWLHDLFNPALREMATHWYPGANKMARGMAKQYNSTPQQASGVMAVLSPQKDWFMNMDQANRVFRSYDQAIKTNWASTPAMRVWGKQFADKKFAGAMKSANKKLRDGKISPEDHAVLVKANESTRAKTRKQFSFKTPPTTDIEKARWLRAHDETSYDRGYNVLSPDGIVIDKAFKKPTKKQVKLGINPEARSAWGSYSAIKKAIAIIEDGSVANISKQLGKEHKVRNFYNNIAHPGDPTNVTIDTHAVAAALVRALSGNSLEVIQNFGGRGVSSSAHSGANGTYGIYHDAYNIAAAERGISPRAMQSITWEAVRGLFKPAQKTAGVDLKVQKIWKQVQADKMSREEGLATVLEMVGGIDDPAWARVVQ